jgi:3D-(3,5/4)-trihydroxycyclohexane-1,2-dione acylhydrolase (decyclizing)
VWRWQTGCPVLFLSGDTFTSRLPDPVLQQVEHFGTPSTTVNDAFRPVVRYWDRLTHPAQVLSSLPQAVATMLDPGDCGPAFIGLPQDIAADAYDYPEAFFETTVHTIARPRPDLTQLAAAAAAITQASRPVIIAGGGVHYSLAEQELADFAESVRYPRRRNGGGESPPFWLITPATAGPLGSLERKPPTPWSAKRTSSSRWAQDSRTSPRARGLCLMKKQSLWRSMLHGLMPVSTARCP